MTHDLLRMLWTRGKESDGARRLMEPFSLVLAAIGLIFLVLALIPGAQI